MPKEVKKLRGTARQERFTGKVLDNVEGRKNALPEKNHSLKVELSPVQPKKCLMVFRKGEGCRAMRRPQGVVCCCEVAMMSRFLAREMAT